MKVKLQFYKDWVQVLIEICTKILHYKYMTVEINIWWNPLWGLLLEASAFIIVTYYFGKEYPERKDSMCFI